jgi:hypothetical protein
MSVLLANGRRRAMPPLLRELKSPSSWITFILVELNARYCRTQTECYSLVETDGVTSSIPAEYVPRFLFVFP